MFLRPRLSLRTFHLDLLLPSRLVITHRSPSRSVFLGCPSHHHPLLLCSPLTSTTLIPLQTLLLRHMISVRLLNQYHSTFIALTIHVATHRFSIPQHSLPSCKQSHISSQRSFVPSPSSLSSHLSSWLLTQMISVSSTSTTFIALKSHVVTNQYSSRNTLFPSSKQSHICSHTNTNPRQTSKTIRAPRPHSYNSHTKPQSQQ